MSSDLIDDLPADQTLPSNNELQLANALFRDKQRSFNQIVNNSKDVLIVGVLFILFSLPQTNELLIRLVPSSASSVHTQLFLKTLACMLVFFLLKNSYLVKK
jgi:hypothetical protein